MTKPQITFLVYMFATGCSQVRQVDYSTIENKDHLSVMKSYTTLWIPKTHDSATGSGDSIVVFLHSVPLDTFKYPSWYSPPMRLHFSVSHRGPVYFEFFSISDTISTRRINVIFPRKNGHRVKIENDVVQNQTVIYCSTQNVYADDCRTLRCTQKYCSQFPYDFHTEENRLVRF